MSEATNEYIPRDGEFDPLAESDEAVTPLLQPEGSQSRGAKQSLGLKSELGEPILRVLSLNEVINYETPQGALMVGDGVIELGEIALLYGPPGSFKGFAVGHLMSCGAQGKGTWLGHKVQARFATLWLNCENGRRRLRDQLRKMNLPPEAEKYIHITDIPGVWDLSDRRLVAAIRRVILEKKIRLLVIDTVSNFLSDEFAKEFSAFFADLNTLLHGIDPRPAILLIHHSRKPKDTDRGARGLLNTISGHQTLQRRARSICYLGRVTDDFDEKRIAAVWLKVSNNGEAEGTRTVVQLTPESELREVEGFDWSEWQGAASGGVAKRESKVKEEHILELFDNGRRKLSAKQAAERLQEIASVGRSVAYGSLKLDGRFAGLLVRDENGLLGLNSGAAEAETEVE